MLSVACRNSGNAVSKLVSRQFHSAGGALYAASALHEQAQRIGKQELREHYERIAGTTRPISPHLSIYKMESHMFLSLANRAAECYLAVGVAAFGGATLIMPDFFNQASMLLASSNPMFTTAVKFAIAAPFSVHLFSMARHYANDMGYLLDRTKIAKVQWATMAGAGLVAVLLTMYTIK